MLKWQHYFVKKDNIMTNIYVYDVSASELADTTSTPQSTV